MVIGLLNLIVKFYIMAICGPRSPQFFSNLIGTSYIMIYHLILYIIIYITYKNFNALLDTQIYNVLV